MKIVFHIIYWRHGHIHFLANFKPKMPIATLLYCIKLQLPINGIVWAWQYPEDSSKYLNFLLKFSFYHLDICNTLYISMSLKCYKQSTKTKRLYIICGNMLF